RRTTITVKATPRTQAPLRWVWASALAWVAGVGKVVRGARVVTPRQLRRAERVARAETLRRLAGQGARQAPTTPPAMPTVQTTPAGQASTTRTSMQPPRQRRVRWP